MAKQEWGDPMSYSDVMSAKQALVKPNKFICIRCRAQATTEDGIDHAVGCPERRPHEAHPVAAAR